MMAGPAAIVVMCFTLVFLVHVERNRSGPHGFTSRVQQSGQAGGVEEIVQAQRDRTRGLADKFAERRTMFTVEEAAKNLDTLIAGFAEGKPRDDFPHWKMELAWKPYEPAGKLTSGQLLQMQRWRQDNTSFTGQLQHTGYLYFVDMMTELCPCNMLIFSVGRDSLIYPEVNALGSTHFLEHNDEWMNMVKANFTKKVQGKADENTVQFHKVDYHTHRNESYALLGDSSGLRMHSLPATVTNRHWDIIFVDGPNGYFKDDIGRMQSIHAAAALAWRAVRSKALDMVHVFVHDTERTIELMYGNAYLNDANILQRSAPSRAGQLAHFVITANSPPPRYEASL